VLPVGIVFVFIANVFYKRNTAKQNTLPVKNVFLLCLRQRSLAGGIMFSGCLCKVTAVSDVLENALLALLMQYFDNYWT